MNVYAIKIQIDKRLKIIFGQKTLIDIQKKFNDATEWW